MLKYRSISNRDINDFISALQYVFNNPSLLLVDRNRQFSMVKRVKDKLLFNPCNGRPFFTNSIASFVSLFSYFNVYISLCLRQVPL
jgi:hypothetical protein